MYAVLYAYTPEIFPTKDRGTGNALTATANRVFGIMGEFVLSVLLPLFVGYGLMGSTDCGDVWRFGNAGTSLCIRRVVRTGSYRSHHSAI
jgi:hypothetical protein